MKKITITVIMDDTGEMTCRIQGDSQEDGRRLKARIEVFEDEEPRESENRAKETDGGDFFPQTGSHEAYNLLNSLIREEYDNRISPWFLEQIDQQIYLKGKGDLHLVQELIQKIKSLDILQKPHLKTRWKADANSFELSGYLKTGETGYPKDETGKQDQGFVPSPHPGEKPSQSQKISKPDPDAKTNGACIAKIDEFAKNKQKKIALLQKTPHKSREKNKDESHTQKDILWPEQFMPEDVHSQPKKQKGIRKDDAGACTSKQKEREFAPTEDDPDHLPFRAGDTEAGHQNSFEKQEDAAHISHDGLSDKSFSPEREAYQKEHEELDARKTPLQTKDGLHYYPDAYRAAREFMKQTLKSPSSAHFPQWGDEGISVASLGNSRYKVVAWVDAQNTYGTFLRNRFLCIVTRVNEEGKWQLDSIDFIR